MQNSLRTFGRRTLRIGFKVSHRPYGIGSSRRINMPKSGLSVKFMCNIKSKISHSRLLSKVKLTAEKYQECYFDILFSLSIFAYYSLLHHILDTRILVILNHRPRYLVENMQQFLMRTELNYFQWSMVKA